MNDPSLPVVDRDQLPPPTVDVQEAVARAIADDGWTCEYHEPDDGCADCARQHRLTADSVLATLSSLGVLLPSGGERPLDEAIEAAVVAYRRAVNTADLDWHKPALAAAVRAAAPIIAAPILAERDEARAKCESLFELLDQGAAAMAAAAQERADLRARLATAERDALLRAADDLQNMTMDPFDLLTESTGARSAVLVALWLRDRAKAADLSAADWAEAGE